MFYETMDLQMKTRACEGSFTKKKKPTMHKKPLQRKYKTLIKTHNVLLFS
jgi:hypothetical protein